MWGQPSIGCGEEGAQGVEGQAGVECQSLGGVEGFSHGRAAWHVSSEPKQDKERPLHEASRLTRDVRPSGVFEQTSRGCRQCDYQTETKII